MCLVDQIVWGHQLFRLNKIEHFEKTTLPLYPDANENPSRLGNVGWGSSSSVTGPRVGRLEQGWIERAKYVPRSEDQITSKMNFGGGCCRSTTSGMVATVTRTWHSIGQDLWGEIGLDCIGYIRHWKAKDGWVAERGDEPFPFDQAMAAAVAGKFDPYVNGKV